MIRLRKKTSPLDQRLEDLRREISAVDRKLRKARRPDGPAPAGTRSVESFPNGDQPIVPPRDLFDQRKSDKARAESEEIASGRSARGQSGRAEPRSETVRPGRERFASYFIAGHFHDLRPSRPEARVLRNKAILMLALVLLALFWLIYFFG